MANGFSELVGWLPSNCRPIVFTGGIGAAAEAKAGKALDFLDAGGRLPYSRRKALNLAFHNRVSPATCKLTTRCSRLLEAAADRER
jgi:hypothetical protein